VVRVGEVEMSPKDGRGPPHYISYVTSSTKK